LVVATARRGRGEDAERRLDEELSSCIHGANISRSRTPSEAVLG
jgi:hypothetical protein